jgi:hypothetical protein
MDRIQSGDLKTFLSLRTDATTSFTGDFPDPVSQTDAAELERLGAAQGLGYGINDDDELAATFAELGVDGLIFRDSDGERRS